MTTSLKVVREINLDNIRCGKCDMVFAVPDYWLVERQETGEEFWCPNGHPRVFKDPENAQLRKEVDALRSKLVHATDQRKAAEAEVAAVKREASQQRKRTANGVCPCCNRSFANLARHMKGQHPDYGDKP